MEKKLEWDRKAGIINVLHDGKKERVIMMREGYMAPFIDEIEKTGGKHSVQLVLRAFLKRIGADHTIDISQLPSFTQMYEMVNDGYFLPLSEEMENIPKEFTWEKGTRKFSIFGDTHFFVTNLTTIIQFKEAMEDVMSERGARAILRNVSKMAGKAVWERAQKDYNWKDMREAIASLDGISSYFMPLYGWGTCRWIPEVDQNGYTLSYARFWNAYETYNTTGSNPVCVLQLSYFEGIAEMISRNLSGNSVESREVKCVSKGDPFCAYVIKEKDKTEKSLDWKIVDEEWKKIDLMDIAPVG